MQQRIRYNQRKRGSTQQLLVNPRSWIIRSRVSVYSFKLNSNTSLQASSKLTSPPVAKCFLAASTSNRTWEISWRLLQSRPFPSILCPNGSCAGGCCTSYMTRMRCDRALPSPPSFWEADWILWMALVLYFEWLSHSPQYMLFKSRLQIGCSVETLQQTNCFKDLSALRNHLVYFKVITTILQKIWQGNACAIYCTQHRQWLFRIAGFHTYAMEKFKSTCRNPIETKLSTNSNFSKTLVSFHGLTTNCT